MWYDGCELYGGVGVSEKVAHGHARCGAGGPHMWFDVPSLREKSAFDEDEPVVVITGDEYERLCGLEDAVNQSFERTAGRPVEGVLATIEVSEYDRLLALDNQPRKRCMNCDGNNVNAPCTCEGV